jgi:paraquat-inducible protein A
MGKTADQKLNKVLAPATAANTGLLSCHNCHLLCRQPELTDIGHPACPRCGTTLHLRKTNSLLKTWALLISAMIMYIPANVLPVTRTTYMGSTQYDTIISGVYYFLLSGSWYIALIIFVASVVVPALKIAVMIFLLMSVHMGSDWRPEERTRLYRIVEAIGRWSMVDIYVISVMVALLKMGNLADIDAGPGAVFFGGVVVITMFAANSFDPRLIWDAMERENVLTFQ